MSRVSLRESVDGVRGFSRFYTRRIGVLREGVLRTPFSLAEARVLFELATGAGTTAGALVGQLDIDAGYMSRMLGRFEQDGLVTRHRSEKDGRQRLLELTERGREAFGQLDARAREEVEAMLRPLPASERGRMLGAMHSIQWLLGPETLERGPIVLRPHEPGDIGWVTHRHGVVYAEEYGWDETFEALVARILGEFVEKFDVKKERSWIAELDGEIVGSVFIAKASDDVAQLRLLLVEPRARGLGLGTKLVDECVRFSRRAGYQRITLWTNSVLLAARHIYEKAGFRIVRAEEHRSFGHDLVGETWELGGLQAT